MRTMTHLKRLTVMVALVILGTGILSIVEVGAGEKAVMTKMKTIDLNTATADELADIEAIGPEKAQSIIDFRNENGPFTAVEDLLLVTGMDETLLAKIRPQLTVETAAADDADDDEELPEPASESEKDDQ